MENKNSSSNRDASQVKVLLIEDHPEYGPLIESILSEEKDLFFHISRAEKLATGLKRIREGDTDLVLLDLSLPDSQGMDTFLRLQTEAPSLPVVVLTGLKDDNLALEVIRRGAQDYVVKGEVDGKMLARILRHAVERHRLQETIRDLSFKDDLTGLYNRRGFLTIAEQHWMLSSRAQREFLILLADLDGLKKINDSFGHQEGDRALVRTAEIFRGTFRKSDILGRMGGDEFAILAIEASEENTKILTRRLKENLKRLNGEPNLKYKLSLSIGVAGFHPSKALSLEKLMADADRTLYAHKRRRKKS